MRALIVEKPGNPPVLSVTQVPDPVPGPGEALVRVAACGFCHHDLLVMKGVLRRGVKPGLILGHEVAGTVVQVGEGVSTLRAGDRVVNILTDACGRCDRCKQGREHRCRRGTGIGHGRDGGFAEFLAVSEHSLVPIPESVDLTGAALFACPMGVSLQAVQQVAKVQPGETVVVTGAGGGLGVHAVQIGAAMEGQVMAVTSSPEKEADLTLLGASQVLETAPLDFDEMVLALTEDEGAGVVIDTVGSALFPATWRSLGQYGRLVLLGEISGVPVSLDLAEVIFRDARILGSSGVSRALVRRVADMVVRGALRPVVSQSLPLDQAATAFDLLSSRSVLGRLVLLPG
ncbi:MAG: alcohol dehydrogenase catalytic domain-containing protein [Dehalococcoidia bacterium]|jgi:D-arabinose 1-dehydrogenase-like Zn-dependent alcohol dehydrogenase|nr:alcohol dehydrogenase catalytic domain-containing protein [Dehalococcoidia bacterium]MDP7085167.1 alcohol dehydrogenase catalytic domain-containing protein [Dehalococcoidia bacterium]MDP7200940.1 alcohol dehydrogenase catalytic domain-containing protein [Dehalococcoidia bacterium]HJN87698.1 alcohol dehydrogenase catalytic domain-containing protein [Dehalococcoidia bacterium]